MIKNVAVYARVSTEEQRKFGISVSDQVNSLTRYCEQNKLKIYDYYVDEGVSAGTISKRKEFVRLLKDLDNIDLIVFTKLDRFSRNVRDANNLLVELDRHNTSFKAIDEDDIDTSTADGRFIFNLKVNLAEHERNKDSERINRVNKYKYHVTKTVCTGAKIFGYNIDEQKHLVINEKEAEQVKALFEKYLETGNLSKTVQWFRTNVANKSSGQIRNYLLDQKYIGIYKTIGTKEELKDFCPRIIDDDLFNSVQELLKKNIKNYNPNNTKRDYIFSGLIVCGNCGFKMAGGTQGKKRNYKKQYRCKQHFSEQRCSMQYSTPEIDIEEFLKNNILNLIQTQIVKSSKTKKVINKNKINELKNKIDKLADLYLNDLISKDKYTVEYNKFQSELKILERENKDSKKDTDTKKLQEFIDGDFLRIYDTLSDVEKQRFWRNIIDKIVIFGKEKIEVKFIEGR